MKRQFCGFKTKPTKPSLYNSQGQPWLEAEGLGLFLKLEKMFSPTVPSPPKVLIGPEVSLGICFPEWKKKKNTQEYTISLTENEDIDFF